MSGVNGINVGGANFNNGVNGVVSKPVNNTSPQKPAENSDKKMSTGMKVGLGAAAVAVSVIAGLAIKNKAAEKAVAKAAKEMGVDLDVKSIQKSAKELGLDAKSYISAYHHGKGNVSKIDYVEYLDINNKVKDKVRELASSGVDCDKYALSAGSLFKKVMPKEGKNFPENSLILQLMKGDKPIHEEVILYDRMSPDIEDLGIFDKIYIKPINIKK